VGWLAHPFTAACWSREAARGITIMNTWEILRMKTFVRASVGLEAKHLVFETVLENRLFLIAKF
jgi:hypothetical protein